ncbi:MAG: AAA family ATPase [Pirellulaceae bacterium]
MSRRVYFCSVPPGTGKTHTVHYLSRALPDTTTLIITSEQIGSLSRYITLARLLQPSLVVIEDADLIARQREEMDTCEEVLLNKLLNELDGLRSDAEINFVLTTNRPETLEAALTARPGRIDQAIEFPLPNDVGRRQLAKLYAGTQQLDESAVEAIVGRTVNTSAAFIKELMRRATQYAIVRGDGEAINTSDIETAVDEMLFSGGAFNRRILGAMGPDASHQED